MKRAIRRTSRDSESDDGDGVAVDGVTVEERPRLPPVRAADRPPDQRLRAAERRDAAAHARDLAALARDQAAAARAHVMARRGVAGTPEADGALTGPEVVARADAARRRVAEDRAWAAEERALAAEERAAAALDREAAARDRLWALADREALAHLLSVAETDPLTGARTRAAGLADLDRELDRARRTNGVLSAAYVDVVGLKRLNDSEGHAAGDELLRRIVVLMRAQLRSYDLIIRIGGDEFLCAMPGMTLGDARRRFDAISHALCAEPGPGALRTGFAALQAGDTANTLIGRADMQLISRDRRGAQ